MMVLPRPSGLDLAMGASSAYADLGINVRRTIGE
jgi:hypothetical protein